jgi:hypothetical protein
MTSYPALVQLLRMLGRETALEALGLAEEPDPAALANEQLQRLQALVDQKLEVVAAELANEAAASDDVTDRESARVWIRDRIAGFAGLLAPGQPQRLLAAAEALTADWG